VEIDRFVLFCFHPEQTQEVGDGEKAVLEANAELFLRAGGLLTFELWASLGSESRAAFVNAGDKLWRERCGSIGLAGQSEVHAISMIDQEAGCDAMARKALNDFNEEMRLEHLSDNAPA